MAQNDQTRKAKKIAAITAAAQKGKKAKSAGALAPAYAEAFYRDVAFDDIQSVDAKTLADAALSVLAFAGQRKPGTAAIRAFNPEDEGLTWPLRRTVIQIVNDNMPFLVDSVTNALNGLDIVVHAVIHPVLAVRRSKTGKLQKLAAGADDADAITESHMQIHVEAQSSQRARHRIETTIRSVLADVRAAVNDWQPMLDQLDNLIDELENKPTNISLRDMDETLDFLRWLREGHFTLLGCREFKLTGTGKNTHYRVVPGSGLGILHDDERMVFHELRRAGGVTPEIEAFLRQPQLLVVTKGGMRSTVHRRAPIDTIGLKKFDDKGRVVGEYIIVGLFTSGAYSRSASMIPYIRRKVDEAMDQSGHDPLGHTGKALRHILENFPRDELFQISVPDLVAIGNGVVALQERRRLALFVRRDAYERFVSVYIYLPRDRYNEELRRRIERIVCEAFDGKITGESEQFGDEAIGRMHRIITPKTGKIPKVDTKALEARLQEAARSWPERLNDALIAAVGDSEAGILTERYGRAFPSSYREQFSAAAAVHDIEKCEEVLETKELSLSLYQPDDAEDHELRLKIYNPGDAMALSDMLPVLENMGLRVINEIPFRIRPAGADAGVRMHDFGLVTESECEIDFKSVRDKFHEAFVRVWRGEMEDDGFNRLVLIAGLDWRAVVVLRAYCKYLRQAGIPFSQAYMEESLVRNCAISANIAALFMARFDPDFKGKRGVTVVKLTDAIETGLEEVANLDEDRIIRHYVNLVGNTLRTNFFQHAEDGGSKPYVSLKFDARNVEALPLPKPLREIFVYSPRFEGVHLRFGFVARGGLRWSDRREDFRTEILGLVKAQQVKNAVIVPVGSKGGFVLKNPPPMSDRDAFMAEGIAVYKSFIRAMLDITDNLVGDEVVAPDRVIRQDADDPYLVVAADKGTATFSDFANGVAQDYGYWLDDAFASGGSVGYDHKKMGITARGAWESVKRHFRELGHNTQEQPFSVIGVGDMSGDVFGNGILLSEQIKMVGAFNHLHIFVDPDPDPAKSFKERKRLFALPRSNWADYDNKLIAKGGGIFDRSAKSVPISAQMKDLFNINANTLTPNQLIQAMLQAPVDLLWFGGIGTYVKSSDESNADAGDRANDPVRVNGEDLNCKVVGEGANLGCTQLGRVEFAKKGGRLYTDFIDNSAGVDCSDHEVNIKICLGDAVRRGRISVKQRNTLLGRMTDEVARLVLRDNYQQTQSLQVTLGHGYQVLDEQQRMIRALERSGHLDRALEFLPDDEDIGERRAGRKGLTAPEVSVLLAYAKNLTYAQLLESDLPDDPLLEEDLTRYFPEPIQKNHVTAIRNHRLRREIIATQVTNSMINRTGPTFVNEMVEHTGQQTPEIARAYTIVREVFDLRRIWTAIEALDNKVPAKRQNRMLLETQRTIDRLTDWFLRYGSHPLDIKSHIDAYKPGIDALRKDLESLMPPDLSTDTKQRIDRFAHSNVPAPLARALGQIKALSTGCDAVRIANMVKKPVKEVARTYFAVGERYHLDGLRHNANLLYAESAWHQMALSAIIDDLWATQGDITAQLLKGKETGSAALRAWEDGHAEATGRVAGIAAEIQSYPTVDLAMLTVANRELRALVAG
jgi:glutamate dehydrogenase